MRGCERDYRPRRTRRTRNRLRPADVRAVTPAGAREADGATPCGIYILQYMKQVLIELDDDVVARLEQVAPGRSRRRSEFIRHAIRRALWDLEEHATAEAYRRMPDLAGAYVDAQAWEAPPKRRRQVRR